MPPFDVPDIIVPPVVTPTPPCNPKTDPECPPPPPDDVPEPATYLVLIVGILGVWLAFRRPPKARIE